MLLRARSCDAEQLFNVGFVRFFTWVVSSVSAPPTRLLAPVCCDFGSSPWERWLAFFASAFSPFAVGSMAIAVGAVGRTAPISTLTAAVEALAVLRGLPGRLFAVGSAPLVGFGSPPEETAGLPGLLGSRFAIGIAWPTGCCLSFDMPTRMPTMSVALLFALPLALLCALHSASASALLFAPHSALVSARFFALYFLLALDFLLALACASLAFAASLLASLSALAVPCGAAFATRCSASIAGVAFAGVAVFGFRPLAFFPLGEAMRAASESISSIVIAAFGTLRGLPLGHF